MSVDLHLVIDGDEGEDEWVHEVNFTYNYGAMWAKACPKRCKKTVHIDGLTGKDSQVWLEKAICSVFWNFDEFEALNPTNGWGNAEDFLMKLVRCLAAARRHPDAVWTAYR